MFARFSYLRVICRVVPAGLLLCAQLLAITGYPAVPKPASGKDQSRDYPCRDRPCGCTSYEECWAGDCCCFSMREKLAWAAKRNVSPPDSAYVAIAGGGAESASCCDRVDSCCSPPAGPAGSADAEASGLTGKWIIGFAAQTCKGQSVAGPNSLPVSDLPPDPFAGLSAELCRDWIRLRPETAATRSLRPDVPPPR